MTPRQRWLIVVAGATALAAGLAPVVSANAADTGRARAAAPAHAAAAIAPSQEQPPGVVNVTAKTGQKIAGARTSWLAKDGPFTVEHVAGRSASGDLLVFFWSPRADWQVVNVSAKTGRKVASGTALTSWQTPDGTSTVEHLAARGTGGELLVFFWTPRTDWQVVDVSAKTGQRLAADSGLVSWQTPDGPVNVEHLAGRNSAGELLVFFWSPRADWQVVNVSSITGKKLGPGSGLTAWLAPDGPFTVEHLAGRSPTGDLLVFFWSPRHNWQAVNVSAKTGKKLVSGTPLESWTTPDGASTVEHVAGHGTSGNLLVFFFKPSTDWRVVDVTAKTKQKVVPGTALASWRTFDGANTIEHLAARNPANQLIVYSWSPRLDWQAANLTTITGQKIQGGLPEWTTPDGSTTVEHLSANSMSGDLLVFFWWTNGFLTLRVHAVQVTDNGGGRATAITPAQVKQWVDFANRLYRPVGIQLLFNASTSGGDWSVVRNTVINNMTGNTDPNWNAEKAASNAVAARWPNSMVVLFRFGPGATATGGGFSGSDLNFVAMPGFAVTTVCGHQNLGLFTHESGHYLGLAHTFAQEFATQAAAQTAFTNSGFNPNIFDGDGLSDTPADPWIRQNANQCGATNSVTLNGRTGTVTFPLPKGNVMSYYDAPTFFSGQQKERIRRTIDSRVSGQGLIVGKP
jgi:hypothetical protein